MKPQSRPAPDTGKCRGPENDAVGRPLNGRERNAWRPPLHDRAELEDGERRARERSFAGACMVAPELVELVERRDIRDPGAEVVVDAIRALGAGPGDVADLAAVVDFVAERPARAALAGWSPGEIAAEVSEIADAREIAAPQALARRIRVDGIRDELRAASAQAAAGDDAALERAVELRDMIRALEEGTERPEFTGREPAITALADVEPESVSWLWHPRIPIGKLTLLVGDPGLGKTWLSLALAAAVSRGWPLPGDDEPREPRDVLFLTAEDGLADTIRPRLDALDACIPRIQALEGIRRKDGRVGNVSLADLDVLEQALNAVRPALLVVDPVQAYLGAGVDFHRANEIRPLLQGLSALAERFGTAVVAIGHLRKGGADRAIYRSLGSIDLAAAARSMLLVAADPDDESRRLVAHAKSNLEQAGETLAYRLSEGIFLWDGTSELDAEQLARPPAAAPAERPRDAAGEWLEAILADGPMSVGTLKEQALAAGMSWRTVERAKTALGIRARKAGFSGGWEWILE